MLPVASVAFQVMVVVPTGYGAFNACPSLRVPPVVTPAQLSVAVGVPGFTAAEHRPGSFGTVMLLGQVITGGSVSLTVTVKLQPGPASVVQLTGVVPTGKSEPAAGVHVTIPQLTAVGAE